MTVENTSWSEADATAAENEGWLLSEYSDGQVCINAIEEDGARFNDDDDAAYDHVFLCATVGSDLHRRALAVCQKSIDGLMFDVAIPVTDGDTNADEIGRAFSAAEALSIAKSVLTDDVSCVSRGGVVLSNGATIDAFIAITVPGEKVQRYNALLNAAKAIAGEAG